MDRQEIAALRRLIDKLGAYRAGWFREYGDPANERDELCRVRTVTYAGKTATVATAVSPNVAQAICAAWNHFPELLDEVDRLTRRNEEVEAMLIRAAQNPEDFAKQIDSASRIYDEILARQRKE